MSAGKTLRFPVLCGVNPDPTNFNSLLNIQWKYGNNGNVIPLSSSNSDVTQSKMENLTSLHIRKAPSDGQLYSCHFNWIDNTTKSLAFTLLINGEPLLVYLYTLG